MLCVYPSNRFHSTAIACGVVFAAACVAVLHGCAAQGSGNPPAGALGGSSGQESAGLGPADDAGTGGGAGEPGVGGGGGNGGSGATGGTRPSDPPEAGGGSGGSGGAQPPDPSETPDNSCAGIEEKAEAELAPSDVIWAIDTSGSMTASFPAIHDALNAFSTRVTDAGIDAHIVLLAGSDLCVPEPLGSGACGAGTPALDTREPEFLHLDIPFGWSAGMSVILDNHPSYKHLLRPNAHVQFVLTEDGPPIMLATDVVDRIEGRGVAPWDPPLLPGSWTFNGIVCVNGTGISTCLISFAVPDTTLELIEMTSGIVADLDLAGQPGADPFAELLDKLATAVIVGAKISCEYEIPPPPEHQEFDRDKVNVVYTDGAGAKATFPRLPLDKSCDDNLAWHYDDPEEPTMVILCPAACDVVQQDLDAQLSVKFGCETVLLE